VATNDFPGTRFLDFGLDFGLFWLVNSLFLQSQIGTSLESQIIVFYFKLGYVISIFKGVGRPVFYLAILSYGQSEDNPKKDLAKFDYKLNMILKKKTILLYFWLSYLNHV
jgi:hypothetical protein